jgi:hypothetical protein
MNMYSIFMYDVDGRGHPAAPTELTKGRPYGTLNDVGGGD